jgi:hypothetical protein
VALTAAVLSAVALAACGSSSSSSSSSASAQSLLKQTFSGSHKIDSGVLSFGLTFDPSGSSTLKGPVSLLLSGPFQSRGAGKLPESNFNISVSALGHHGTLGIVSAGSSGYLTLQGQAYQLPAADFQRLSSSLSGASGSGSGGLSKLGIDPLHWLTNPSLVGTATVGGASTTHIRAGVNVAALLTDLSTFLQKAASSSGTAASGIPTTISPANRTKIAAAVKNATVDVWTGSSDKTLRKLSISLSLPVTGQMSTLLGGLSSAAVGMTLQYANLNQPQTIAAPTSVQPFTQFVTKVRSVMTQLEGTLGATGLGSTTSSGSSSSSGAGSAANAAGVQKYTKCIQSAAGDVTKMQKCASLLSAK